MALLESTIFVPVELFTDEDYKDLSNDAKVLYGILLHEYLKALREHGEEAVDKPFELPIETVMQLIGCGKNKAISTIQELQSKRLIRKKRIGQNQPNHIYIRDIFNFERTIIK